MKEEEFFIELKNLIWNEFPYCRFNKRKIDSLINLNPEFDDVIIIKEASEKEMAPVPISFLLHKILKRFIIILKILRKGKPCYQLSFFSFFQFLKHSIFQSAFLLQKNEK